MNLSTRRLPEYNLDPPDDPPVYCLACGVRIDLDPSDGDDLDNELCQLHSDAADGIVIGSNTVLCHVNAERAVSMKIGAHPQTIRMRPYTIYAYEGDEEVIIFDQSGTDCIRVVVPILRFAESLRQLINEFQEPAHSERSVGES